jgi:hypothetical protein
VTYDSMAVTQEDNRAGTDVSYRFVTLGCFATADFFAVDFCAAAAGALDQSER